MVLVATTRVGSLARTEPGCGYSQELLAELAANIPQGLSSGAIRYRRILIPLLVGASDLFILREGLIAHALRMRGADVAFVLCDGLPVCDARTIDNDRPDACTACFGRGADSLVRFGHSTYALSSFIDLGVARRLWDRARERPAEALFSDWYAGVDLGPFVYASTLRYFRSGGFDPQSPAQRIKAREYLGAALVQTEAARRAITILKPDKVFSSHGIYVSWGPWAGLSAAMNIPYDSYGGAWRRNTLIAQHDQPRGFHCDDLWERVRDRPLSAQQCAELDVYLATREDNSADFLRYFDGVDRDLTALYSRLGVNPAAFERRTAIFTNVAWDAAPLRPQGAFSSPFDLVEAVIERTRHHPKTLLLIKVHPAESRHLEATSSEWTMRTVIERRIGTLPDNIRWIGADDNVSNLALYRTIDFGLVHTSSVGLEMALAGLPVLTPAAGAHYDKPGLVAAIGDRGDYLRRLDRWLAAGPDFSPDVESARRYAYTLYFRKSLPFEPVDVIGWSPESVRIRSLAELAPGRFRGLDALCDGILLDSPFAVADGTA